MGKNPSKRWWEERPQRWHPKLEDALASGDPGRIGIAWAIIRHEVDPDHGSIKAAAKAWDVDNGLLGSQLTGAKPWTLNVMRKIAAASKTQLSVLVSGAHPLGVPNVESAGYCEPGDPNWETVWAALRVSDPSIPSERELRENEPLLFPDS